MYMQLIHVLYLNPTLTGVILCVPAGVPFLEDHTFSLSLTFNETFTKNSRYVVDYGWA